MSYLIVKTKDTAKIIEHISGVDPYETAKKSDGKPLTERPFETIEQAQQACARHGIPMSVVVKSSQAERLRRPESIFAPAARALPCEWRRAIRSPHATAAATARA